MKLEAGKYYIAETARYDGKHQWSKSYFAARPYGDCTLARTGAKRAAQESDEVTEQPLYTLLSALRN